MNVSDKGTVSASANATLTIGTSTSSSASLVIDNKLGMPVNDIAFSAAGATGELTYLMESGQSWDNDVVAQVNYEKRAAGVNYDIHVKAGENDIVLHDLDLDGVRELTMRVENGVAYATFERDGSAVSSLQQESDLARQMGTAPIVLPAAAAAAAQPEEPAAEENAAEPQPEEAQPSDEGASNEGGEYYEEVYYEDYSGGESYGNDVVYEAPAQQEQGCVEGGVQLR